jgi:DNA-binding NarL/FixJ family response regulator
MSTNSALAANRHATVLIAEDNPAMLQGVCGVVSPYFKVEAAANDGAAALQLAEKINPSLILLDIRMPGLDGFSAARELARRKSCSKIVFLTAQEDDDYISEALRVGARGYVMKRRMASDLIPALNLALNEQFFISPHAFSGIPKPETNGHVLHFYASDAYFFQHAAELTYAALTNKELVFMFMSGAGITFVREELRARGLDYKAAIRTGQYWVISIEHVLSSAPDGDSSPDVIRLHAMLRTCLKRAIADSQNSGARLTVFSDLMPTLLRQGHGYEVAARIEGVWNDLIPKHDCTVYCGCLLVHLGPKASRKAISKVCCEHSNVIFIDR